MDKSKRKAALPGTFRTPRRRAAAVPALPYAKAFVVQFAEDAGPRLKPAKGRVEHLQTGRRAGFASVAELFACMVLFLSDAESAKQGGPPTHADRPRASKSVHGADSASSP